jgi:hypothetical protein
MCPAGEKCKGTGVHNSIERPVVRPTQVATVLEPDIYEALVERAKTNERSVAAEVRLMIRTCLKEAA